MVVNFIGVISDTHGLLRPEAADALDGAEMILHAGDVGSPAVLESLRRIAPVYVVRGNVDKGEWADDLPEWEVIEIGSHSIYMLHDVKALDLKPEAAGCRVVVSGHSHRPSVREHKGVLYSGHGGAGPRRFRLPVSVAHLKMGDERVSAEIVRLAV